MKTRLALTALAAFALVACNDASVNRSIPPITGIAGGPNQTGGSGMVSMEVKSDPTAVVPASTITVTNLNHPGAHGSEVAGGDPYRTILLSGDVGDTLRVDVTHPTEGEISRDFVVPRPTILDVHDAAGSDSGVVLRGHVAQIQGEGFCASGGDCNTIVLTQGAAHVTTGTVETPRPGLIYFVVPTDGVAVGAWSLDVRIAGSDGADPNYDSESFPITVNDPS